MENGATKIAEVNNVTEIDLLDLFHYLVKKLHIIIIVVLIATVLAGIYGYVLATPMYESTAQIYVVNSQDSVVNLSDLQIGSYLTNDYQHVFDTWEVNQQVIENLSLPYSVGQLKNMTTVTNLNNTRILYVTVHSTIAKEAADIANELARVASQYISDVMLTDQPTMLSTALEPKTPYSPQKMRVLIIGALLGGVAIVGILTLVYMFDDKVKTGADVQKYAGMVPLAVIPMTELIYSTKNENKKSKGW